MQLLRDLRIQIWDIIDKLKSQGVKIKAEVQSHAMSAGLFLFMLADERRMNKLGTLLYHEILIGNSMKLSDWNLETHRMDKIQKALDKLVTDNTNITQDMLDKYFDYEALGDSLYSDGGFFFTSSGNCVEIR